MGHASPPGHWYDQQQDEWVLLVAGSAVMAFEDGSQVLLAPGDHLLIPGGCRHRVAETDAHGPTVWVAVHIDPLR